MSSTDEKPFRPASELLANRHVRLPDAQHTHVEYADGSRAVAIHPRTVDPHDPATSEWISAIGDSFVALEDWR